MLSMTIPFKGDRDRDMTKPIKDSKKPRQEPSWWSKYWFYTVLILLALLGVPSAFFVPPIIPGLTNDGNTVVSVRQGILAVLAGALTMLTLSETHRKNTHEKDKNYRDHTRQVYAERRSRYTAAVEQLANEKAAVRLGGIYTLVGLADEWLADDSLTKDKQNEEGQVIINNLCSYIRSPFPLAEKIDEYKAYKKLEELKKKESENLLNKVEQLELKALAERFPDTQDYKTPEDITTDYVTFHEEQDVRRTIFVEMGKRSSVISNKEEGDVTVMSGAWSDFDFDFSQAHIFYPFYKLTIEKGNFSGAKFYAGTDFFKATFNNDAYFGKATFTSNVNFVEAIFNSDAYFGEATFNNLVNFGEATFNNEAHFSKATFNNIAYFGETTFNNIVHFGETTFNNITGFVEATFNNVAGFGETIFNNIVHFGKATFNNDAYFGKATFNNIAGFGKATFNNVAGFVETTFNNEAHFGEATFNNITHFGKATFNNIAGFGKATFNDEAHFSKATFNNDTYFGEATFNNIAGFVETTFNNEAHFGEANLNNEAHFGKATFIQTANFWQVTFAQNANFSGATFTGDAYFIGTTFNGGTRFEGTNFSRYIYFQDATFSGEMTLRGSDFEKYAPTFVDTSGSARFSAQVIQKDYIFSVRKGSKPILCGTTALPPMSFTTIPLGAVLFDPDSWDEEKQEYTRVSEPAEPLDESDEAQENKTE